MYKNTPDFMYIGLQEHRSESGMTETKDATYSILSGARMPRNFSWIVDNRLAGMGYPDDESNIHYLIINNIRHVVSLTESTPCILESFQELEVLSVKVKDFTPPTLDQIDLCLEFIERCNDSGNAVVVHCAHGRGRTGTVLACCLVKTFNMTGEVAIKKLREMRPGSVETSEQEDMVKTFSRTITNRRENLHEALKQNVPYNFH